MNALLSIVLALGSVGQPSIGGYVTWYDTPGMTAAAGPDVRSMLGSDWRGQLVTVCATERCVSVRLTDWCACGDRHGKATLLDLSRDAFARLAPLSAGVMQVTVEPVGDIALPATDIAPDLHYWLELVR